MHAGAHPPRPGSPAALAAAGAEARARRSMVRATGVTVAAVALGAVLLAATAPSPPSGALAGEPAAPPAADVASPPPSSAAPASTTPTTSPSVPPTGGPYASSGTRLDSSPTAALASRAGSSAATRQPVAGEAAFLTCVRQRESRGDYGVINTSSGAGGAYQFLPETWATTALHAGRPDLAAASASTASPADQDAMARHLLRWQGRDHWAGDGC